jgi:phenylacetate-CoA ligase
MSIRLQIKQVVESLPEELTRLLVYVPYVFRLGIQYERFKRKIVCSEQKGCGKSDTLDLVKDLVKFAFNEIPFYREFYSKKGFSPSDLNTWDDWSHVPIVTKADFQAVPLIERKAHSEKGMKINTGGTSGQPLEFYLDNQAFAREWAHMHYIWKAHGYRPEHLKLTFRGKHFDPRQVMRYNAVHNEYIVNANVPMRAVVEEVLALPHRTLIRWLHGYPSLIAEFAHTCKTLPSDDLAGIRSQLFGVLLGSEYPAPVYRSVIEDVLSSNIVTWYGHSEMAIMARETACGVYESLPTYGYAEAVQGREGHAHRLICTSLYNRVHPFIRYDTGDLIEPVSQHAGSLAFRVVEGRVGDFIIDRQGMKHSLTAIIFGRHHTAFGMIKHIQVRQDAPGQATFLLTPKDKVQDKMAIQSGLDFNDLDLEWGVELMSEPVRSASGKIKLKVDSVKGA